MRVAATGASARNWASASRSRAGQIGRLLGGPACPVVVGHVAGQQAAPVGREPLELAAQLHPAVVAHCALWAPLVVGPAGPGRGSQPGRGHQPGVARVEAERVQHPRGPRVTARHLPLVAQAVNGIADRGLGAGQVGVGLVVVAADDLHPAVRDELAQHGPVSRVSVQVGLEVVDLGQHELVVRVVTRGRQVQCDQLERGAHLGQPAVLVRQQQPGLGELALGVPPHRVVVEVADHPHGPAGLGHRDLGRQLGPAGRALGDHCDRPALARPGRRGHPHADFRGLLPARRREVQPGGHRCADRRPGHRDLDRPGIPPAIAVHGYQHELQWFRRGAAEQFRCLYAGDSHVPMVTRRRGMLVAAGNRLQTCIPFNLACVRAAPATDQAQRKRGDCGWPIRQ